MRHGFSKLLIIMFLTLSCILTSLTIYTYTAKNPSDALRDFRFRGEAKAIVAVVKAERANVYEALSDAFRLLDLDTYIKPGYKIMVKPNVVRAQAPPATTHPETLGALIDLLKSTGSSQIVVAEGSGEGNTLENFRILGLLDVASNSGVEVVDLNVGEFINVTIPDGKAFQNVTLSKRLFEVDFFISLACLKTHSDAVVTLGLKNLIGIPPSLVYGSPKGKLHEADNRLGGTYMAAPITDLATIRPINLTIIDGIVAMEGLGPTQGTPVNMGLIIVGKDPVATDSIAALIMGFNPRLIPTLKMAVDRELGVNDPAYIEVRGVSIEEVFRPFSTARTEHQRFQIMTRDEYILHESRVTFLTASAISWVITVILVMLRVKSKV
ncbi:DUF362 domain-containing protein [Candidatus Bathyarchaeota archaeon]|nr:DUF362 domain-containing protein [Candidatus Bathyarchaeota archaeon]